MKTLEVYDPALCCSSGVCGPSPDQTLIDFSGALEKLKAAGIEVIRFNLAQEPLAFAQKTEVKSTLEKDGDAGLPLIFIDGELKFQKSYPSLQQLQNELGLAASKETKIQFAKVNPPKAFGQDSCCDNTPNCC